MQKATPLVLILILAVTATCLSMRAKHARPVSGIDHCGRQSRQGPEAPDSSKDAKPSPTPAATAKQPVPPAKVEAAVAKVTPRPWPQASSDIAPDPGITFGTLDNGLRYMIQPNSEPPKRVSVRLHIATGSLMEADDQQGIAHFLEHMVFNGSKNYSAADLIPAHAAARHRLRRPCQRLHLVRRNRLYARPAGSIGGHDGTRFTVMRDFGDGAMLDAEEIDKERGVILAEKTSRDSVDYRLMEQQFTELLPDSLITRRFPIGTEEVIKSAPRERFVDFYTRYYTPGTHDLHRGRRRRSRRNAAARIETTFGSMSHPAQARHQPGPRHDPPARRDRNRGVHRQGSDLHRCLADAGAPACRKPDTAATRAERMPLEIAHSIIDRRFERISKQKNSPVAAGSAARHDPVQRRRTRLDQHHRRR